jgi:hypothetical protein
VEAVVTASGVIMLRAAVFRLRTDGTSYEVHIPSWHSQDRLLQSIMTQRCKLVSTDSQGGVGTVGRGREGGGSGVVKNKGPNKSEHLNR